MSARRPRTPAGKTNRATARSSSGGTDTDVHLNALKKRCNAKGASMRKLFSDWEQRPGQTLSQPEFFETLRLANVGGVTRSVGNRLAQRLSSSRDDGAGVSYGKFAREMAGLGSASSRAAPRPMTAPEAGWSTKAPRHPPRAQFCGKKLRDRVRGHHAKLDESFKSYDANGDGWLSRPEFATLVESAGLGLTEMDVDIMVREADTDKNGKIDYAEFSAYLDPPIARPCSTRAVSLFEAPEGFINQPKYELRDRMLAKRIHKERHITFGQVGRDAVWAPWEKREKAPHLKQTMAMSMEIARSDPNAAAGGGAEKKAEKRQMGMYQLKGKFSNKWA